MFIAQAFKPENKFWKYIAGLAIVFVASMIGQIPFGLAIAVKGMSNGGKIPTTEAEMLRYLDLNLSLFLILLSFGVALLALGLVVVNLHRQKFKDVITSRNKVDWSRIFFSFGVWAVFSVASVLLVYFTEPGKYILQFNAGQFIILAVIALLMIPVQTTAEELIFRGYMMQGFGLLAKNRWLPLVVTSVIFGALHLANPEVAKMGYIVSFYYIGTGLFLGILTLMDEGTELALGFHAANNITAALLVTADWTAFQTHSVFKDVSEPSAGWDIFLPLLIIYPIVLLIMTKKYKWHSWKEKLTGTVHPQIQTNQTPANHE